MVDGEDRNCVLQVAAQSTDIRRCSSVGRARPW